MSQFPSTSNPSQSAPAGSGQLVIVGFVIAVIAVILMNVYVEMRVAAQKEDTVTYFLFRNDLKAGEKIDMEDLKAVDIPTTYEEAFGLSAIREDPGNPGKPLDGLGNLLKVAVTSNQMLTSNQLFGSGVTSVRDQEDRFFDEITLNIDSKEQPPNLQPGDYIDLRASVPLNRDSRFMVVMEYVKVVNLGDRIQETGTRAKTNKYGSITIYVEPELSNQLFDIQKRVDGQTFNVTRRDPNDKAPRKLKTGGSKEINEEVLETLNLK